MTADERKRQIAVAVMAAGGTVVEAAKTAETEPATVQSWLAEPAFAAALETARDRAFTDALARIKTLTGRAVGRLAAMINDKSAGESRRAAIDVITLAIRLRESDEMEKRLESIENRLAEMRPGKKSNFGG